MRQQHWLEILEWFCLAIALLLAAIAQPFFYTSIPIVAALILNRINRDREQPTDLDREPWRSLQESQNTQLNRYQALQEQVLTLTQQYESRESKHPTQPLSNSPRATFDLNPAIRSSNSTR
ncbi:MAG: hypothetical protein OT478_10970 [Cyanobacteria bacterium FC1]|nr:hypothetical protein [Cyanobacteria bacterium FC1]